MIILWIDPWTTTVWFALVEKEKNIINLVDYWVIETLPNSDLKDKLIEMIADLNGLINKYKPEKVVIEKLFFITNLKTWIDVAQARGAIIYEVAKRWIKIEEYTPLELKSAICSNWKASKKQLQNAIKIFFWLDDIPKPDDAADAIWLAYMGALNNVKI